MDIDFVSWAIAPSLRCKRGERRPRERVHAANINDRSTFMTQHRSSRRMDCFAPAVRLPSGETFPKSLPASGGKLGKIDTGRRVNALYRSAEI